MISQRGFECVECGTPVPGWDDDGVIICPSCGAIYDREFTDLNVFAGRDAPNL